MPLILFLFAIHFLLMRMVYDLLFDGAAKLVPRTSLSIARA
jgi:hypothetical protein